ncbi:tyrosine-type recombinase/integrase [Vibrio sp. TH_r3]|uniref:tyrosine-type recombinase/integrase n=1 Tax=Vibrio sp. TH_r3 TaxID=3082084 RepID=UPI0029531307|nr:tyrosine-type recombinase/integrase [Vibrio sp. TH_r3]MDV7106363.1 tyrosine-type recombinase/integrase [Vibrio sp. TH_r3]
MSAANLPALKKSQVTLSHLKSQDDVSNEWQEQKEKLHRFKLQLPDLSQSFAPDWNKLPEVLNNLTIFEENRGGYSSHTLKMLSFVIRKWDEYCKSEEIYSFPINDVILLNWFKALKLKFNMKINTLKQYKAQMSLFHKIMGVDDITKTLRIAHFFKSLPKDEMELTGSQVIELQAKPFRKQHLEQLMKLWGNEKVAIPYRDLTVLTVAYGTLLREGEIGNIRKKHVKILENGDINIERVTSKTSISPEPKRLTGRFSVIFKRYLATYCGSLDDEDFVFCWITTKGIRPGGYRQTPMSGMTVDRIYQRAHKVLEERGDVMISKDSQRNIWSGHSSRVGALQDGYMSGLSPTQLIQLGDWKNNEMVFRYLRALDNNDSPNLLLQN